MNRPNCQAENPSNKKFCSECGAQLVEICPQYGAKNSPAKKFCGDCGCSLNPSQSSLKPTDTKSQPTSFANGRYQVRKFLGEGGKKKVYLAHDATLGRDVAFPLIKTGNNEKLS